jgi:hypothetical protein
LVDVFCFFCRFAFLHLSSRSSFFLERISTMS